MKTKILVFFGMIALVFFGVVAVTTGSFGKDKKVEEYIDKAIEYGDQGYYYEASKELDKAIALDENNLDAQVNRVLCLYLMEDYSSFVQASMDFLNKFGPDRDIYITLVEYYTNQRDYANALKYVDEARTAFPVNETLMEQQYDLRGTYQDLYEAYVYVSEFHEGYAIAETEKGFRLINSTGNYADGNKCFDAIYDFYKDEEGILQIAVQQEGRTCFYDEKGRLRVSPEENYIYLGGFHDGYALVEDENGFSYIDKDMKKQEVCFEDATAFCNGIAAVKKDGKWSLINNKFEQKTEFVFDEVLYDEYRCCSITGNVFVRTGNAYYLVNEQGERLSEDYEEVRNFVSKDGTAAVKKDGWGAINANGEEILECQYVDVYAGSQNMIAISANNNGTVLMQEDGEEYAYIDSRIVSSMSEKGCFVVEKDGHYRLIRLNSFVEEESLF